jgi:hypothetical protein
MVVPWSDVYYIEFRSVLTISKQGFRLSSLLQSSTRRTFVMMFSKDMIVCVRLVSSS